MSDTANTLQNVGAGFTPPRPFMPRALVLRAPGIKCDRETAHVPQALTVIAKRPRPVALLALRPN